MVAILQKSVHRAYLRPTKLPRAYIRYLKVSVISHWIPRRNIIHNGRILRMFGSLLEEVVSGWRNLHKVSSLSDEPLETRGSTAVV